MRLSCNGCRVLRKGCSGDCPIRPCLQWIKSPQSQANATLFLAKFYGRAGLINLINAAAPHLRPAAFKSLLDEACGRIVNPTFGCSGLLSSGRWDLCEAAVEAVLNGAPIMRQQEQVSSSSWESSGCMLKAGDIRHVAKSRSSSSEEEEVHREGSRKRKGGWVSEEWGSSSSSGVSEEEHGIRRRRRRSAGEGDSCSVDTVEAEAEGELDLSLTLGWGPHSSSSQPTTYIYC